MAKRVTTVGQVLINRALPKELRDYQRILDAKGIKQLLREVAERFPDRYREIAHDLMQVARRVAYETGGNSFGIRHLRRTPYSIALRRSLDRQVERILDDDSLTDEQREKKLLELAQKYQKEQQQKVYEEALAEQNPLAMQVFSGARGKPANLSSLLGSDLLYVDHRDRPIPLPVRKNYSEGLSPLEYWSGAYGARKGVIDVKKGTADAGFFGKQLAQLAHRLVVVGEDDEEVMPPTKGLPVDTDDEDNEGALLAAPVGGYPRNTILTPKILRDLSRRGYKRILVRSPVLGGPAEGGVLARDVGVRETGRLPSVGELTGMTAAQALSEPIAQGSLCLVKGTRVRMADGSVKPIEEIRPGDYVLGADTSARAFPVRVLRVFDNGRKPCYRTWFRYCKGHDPRALHLDSTLDHKILAITMKWTCSGERWNHVPRVLPVGTKCAEFSAVLPESVELALRDSRDDALLLGLLLGDGCYTKAVHGVHLSSADPSLVAQLGPILARHNLKLTKLKGHKYYYRLSSIEEEDAKRDSNGRFLPGFRNPAMRLLQELGMWGRPAHEKEIPQELLQCGKQTTTELLAGLWITDGTIYLSEGDKPHVGFGSTSLKLCSQVRELLAERYAVYGASIHTQVKDRRRPLHSFTVTAHSCVQRMFREIPLLGEKAERVRKWAGMFVPSKNVQYSRCSRTGQEYLGELPTYDIEVDHPDHLFVLENGLIVSNSSKHSGGVAGEAKTVSGFQLLDALVQFPSSFQGAAVHAQKDGTVGGIQPAPAGGHYLYIDGEKHYVPESATLKVKPGDVVEAGDVLTSGVPHPAEIIRHKGIGEGRRYFVQAMVGAMRDAGITAHRRNVELVARGLIDHVKMTDEWEDYLPDDIVGYNALERRWKPREGSQKLRPRQAAGQYLERPYLHYTIGTKLRPSVIKTLEEFGINEVETHRDPPPFVPEPVRAMYSLQHDPDPLTRMYGSGLKKSLLDATHRGAVSDEEGTSFVPALARGVEFGHIGKLQHKQAGLLEDSEDSLVAPGLSPLQQLIRLKQLSDQGRYRDKSQIARALIASRPDEFFIDSDDHPYVYGLTHRPTGFRFHLPRHEVPKVLLSQPVQEEETTHGTS